EGALEAIVEDKDASEKQRAIDLCNAGVMAIDASCIESLLARIGNDNAKGEYYLTDIVGLARNDGRNCSVVTADEDELMGVDSRADLARAEGLWQAARRRRAMDEGVTLLDPDTVYFSHDTILGTDVIVGPNVVFGPCVEVENNVEIRAFCHVEGAKISEGALIGPYARLRPGTEIGEDVHIGNFVELKNTTMAPGAKANHLAYVGDTEVGAGANIGAGTITCNYDGFEKHKTIIGDGAFIGSNSALVAPVMIGKSAIVGAGSTIARNVAADALAIERSKQIDLAGRAKAFREDKAAAKAAKKKG
ncbi:MAG: DapH/DapD/GlmU-related protein, partial [Pseudomonadota bacterium]|nr:DapH/DapD/GlmU-related protein [Pseudomonadota bacterium]